MAVELLNGDEVLYDYMGDPFVAYKQDGSGQALADGTLTLARGALLVMISQPPAANGEEKYQRHALCRKLSRKGKFHLSLDEKKMILAAAMSGNVSDQLYGVLKEILDPDPTPETAEELVTAEVS